MANSGIQKGNKDMVATVRFNSCIFFCSGNLLQKMATYAIAMGIEIIYYSLMEIDIFPITNCRRISREYEI